MLVKIERMDHLGNGIGYINNKIIFVKGALIGETVDVDITKEKRTFYEGKLRSIIVKSSKRIEPFCPYFGLCGGCNLQHLNYLDTLDYKKNRVLNILNRFDLPNPVIINNENNLYYRNKIELKIVNKKIGFYEKNTNKLIEINECKITKKSINKVISLIKSFNLNYANIIIRSNYNDEVLIIINSKENISFNDDLSKYKILGIILNDKTIYGENHFMEKIDNLYFDVSYDAFFQVNNFINNKLFEIIKENVSGENILDLYSGVGTLSIMASQKASIVYAIEINENAIKNALLNAKINKIKNVNFILGKVEDKINLINDKIDTVIVDPPRSGLDKKTIDYLKKINASKIIYISCDTQSLANNLNDLINDYTVEKLYLLDMFSYTYHIECVCVLKLK